MKYFLCHCPQDEIEFGYIDSPHHGFPVVLDSPRDGDLLDFPYEALLVSQRAGLLCAKHISPYYVYTVNTRTCHRGQTLVT